MKFRNFSWLNNIPVWVRVCMCVYHIFFSHSPIDGHLGFFCLLAVVTSTAVNVSVQISIWVFAFDSSGQPRSPSNFISCLATSFSCLWPRFLPVIMTFDHYAFPNHMDGDLDWQNLVAKKRNQKVQILRIDVANLQCSGC